MKGVTTHGARVEIVSTFCSAPERQHISKGTAIAQVPVNQRFIIMYDVAFHTRHVQAREGESIVLVRGTPSVPSFCCWSRL
jgi:hypothetical protein